MQLNFRQDKRAAVAVEAALVSVFLLFPLLAGLTDFFFIIAAKYQLNGAQAALYNYAWNNPANAANTTQLQSVLAVINQHSLPQVTLSAAAYNVATPQWGVGGSTVTVTYTLVSSVKLPVPLPFNMPNPFTVSTTGTVQLQ
jgi:Flp pilus assembly protein TadG